MALFKDTELLFMPEQVTQTASLTAYSREAAH